jgi:hypothetical protein
MVCAPRARPDHRPADGYTPRRNATPPIGRDQFMVARFGAIASACGFRATSWIDFNSEGDESRDYAAASHGWGQRNDGIRGRSGGWSETVGAFHANRCESDRRSRGSDGLGTKVLLHPGRVFRYRFTLVDGAYAARRATTCPSTPTPPSTIPPKVPSPPTHGASTAQARGYYENASGVHAFLYSGGT